MILGYMVKALIELNSAFAIAGVRAFGKEVFGTDLEFTWPAEFLAAGKFELALEHTKSVLAVEGLNKFSREFLTEMVCYLLNDNWNNDVFSKFLSTRSFEI